MPEFVEVEAYRRTMEPLLGVTVDRFDIIDHRLLRRRDHTNSDVIDFVEGHRIEALHRHGKLLVVTMSNGAQLGFTFGLRGWLTLDDHVAKTGGGELHRAPRPDHVRWRMTADGHHLELEDVLRLSTVEVDPDTSRLGPDVLEVDRSVAAALCATSSPIKTALMDQRRIAGIGNLIADEILFEAGIDPRTSASGLTKQQVDDLYTAIVNVCELVFSRSGSHQGAFIQSGSRERHELCPRCTIEVQRVVIGGRTTYFCPHHQT